MRRLAELAVAGLPLALGLLLGTLWWIAEPAATSDLAPLHLLLFVVAVAGTELLPMRQPGGRPVPTSTAVIATVALLGAAPPIVAAVGGVGYVVARLARRQAPDPGALVLRVVGGWTLAGVAAAGALLDVQWTGTATQGGAVPALDLGAGALVAVAIVVGMPTYQTLTRTPGRLEFLPRRAAEAIARSWLAGVAVASTALLGGIVHEVLGGWTLPTMLIPLFAARIGLEHFADATRAYDQTIRAMSRLPEQLGTVEPEHGVRVGRLAVSVGLELGLEADLLVDLEHAAHLHELGRIRMDHDLEGATRRDLADAGASIVRETASLDRVAEIIAASGDPYGAPRSVAVPARIIAACCDVDDYGADASGDARRQEMMVRLVRDVGDLEVVAALSRVLDRAPAVEV
jgi:hypothetical protein